MHLPDTFIDHETPRCLIIGVGGCGCAIINKMIATAYGGVTYIAVDSDFDSLKACKAERKIFISKAVLKNTDEAESELQTHLADIPCVDMVFVVSGMGGATGTKISPTIAEYAKQREALTIGVAMLPLPDEGGQYAVIAEKGLPVLRQAANSMVVVQKASFQEADQTIITGITGIAGTVTRNGLLGVDLADLKEILGNGSIAHIGYASANGKDRARQAIEKATSSPAFVSGALEKAPGVILVITGDNNMNIDEVSETTDIVTGRCKEHAKILFQGFHDGKAGEFSVLIVACEEVVSTLRPSPLVILAKQGGNCLN